MNDVWHSDAQSSHACKHIVIHLNWLTKVSPLKGDTQLHSSGMGAAIFPWSAVVQNSADIYKFACLQLCEAEQQAISNKHLLHDEHFKTWGQLKQHVELTICDKLPRPLLPWLLKVLKEYGNSWITIWMEATL